MDISPPKFSARPKTSAGPPLGEKSTLMYESSSATAPHLPDVRRSGRPEHAFFADATLSLAAARLERHGVRRLGRRRLLAALAASTASSAAASTAAAAAFTAASASVSAFCAASTSPFRRTRFGSTGPSQPTMFAVGLRLLRPAASSLGADHLDLAQAFGVQRVVVVASELGRGPSWPGLRQRVEERRSPPRRRRPCSGPRGGWPSSVHARAAGREAEREAERPPRSYHRCSDARAFREATLPNVL